MPLSLCYTQAARGLIHEIEDQAPLSAMRRLEIYQNAYKIRLRGLLEHDHETLRFYLGDELLYLMLCQYMFITLSGSLLASIW